MSFCVDEFNNLFGTNPQFADAENGDYHLTGSSPFINTGAPYIEQDPDNSTADIGAHYYPQIQGNISEDMIFSSEVKFLGNVLIEPGVQVTIMPGTSYVDYYPYLSQPPFSKLISKSPEESAYDMAFRKVVLSDTNLTDEKVMESFNHTWPIKRKLNFARNLNFLGFPHLVDNICRDVINNNPDSSEAYLAIDLLWDSGRMTDDDFVNFKTYLDSLSLEGDEEEIYEEAEMISDGFMTEQSLAKRSTSYYLKFKSPEIASQALLDLFINALLNENDYELASQIYNRLKSEFPASQATLEAINHLGIMQDNFDLPEELIIPDKYELLGNYPNPFNPYTHIKFSIPKISSVEIQIFNILGQKARTLRVDPILPGIYKITWDGKNSNGIRMSSGTYIYRIKAESLTGDEEKFVKSSKMVLLK